ncbi:FlgN protein [Moorella sp. E308F]|uniref:flagellar protein FlgN n=1 Tax=Moorella sp. E308F TaxID=2572682 RepID=UPI0010FFC3BC|nr:flagellar protein FlgN [Moorella sp. E308F]GEA14913.1 FlgN protein [Moorella sp. E308F]
MRELATVLQAELDVVRELLTVCRQEQDALVADNITAIREAAGRKGELARRLAVLEEERQQVMAGQPGTQEIEKLRDLLRQAVRELQEANETNRLLARQSLAYVQKMLALLMPTVPAPVVMDRLV